MQLKRPLSIFNPKAWYFAATRLNIRIGSKVSQGLKLGMDTGFDSGSTLDYVYENKARGTGFLGKNIDRTYLNAIGWRGIRIRKHHIETMLIKAATLLRKNSMQVRILDIAAGHGRYVLESALAVEADHILLRDYSELNVTGGRAILQNWDYRTKPF